ncbi:PREDICTED: uncharacterized protein LOC104705350 [Camelina sativa]|uniref:Uncharacterized protein LOC104705350 n=1 Tax=Camelina sativa TaxID=90675 RepID=A0ABM0T1T3_CAMSA|nr:PREDICTED: uncharacterized protein LOC104705350 [Camelina sativa]
MGNPRYALLSHKVYYPEPKTIAEALKHPRWNGAMRKEMGNCKAAYTWSLTPLASYMNVLGSNWVFRMKRNADGSLQKLKARLVAKGFNQEERIDYLETYNHVIRTATVRASLDMATKMGWDINQMDVEHAFLHGDLTETVYMKQPAGFVDPEKPYYKQDFVARSSTEAEYKAMSDAAAEISWICNILIELGIPQYQPPELYCDNLSAVYLTANLAFHKKSKHFANHYHYVRKKVALGTVLIKHIPGHEQIADIFTKSFPVRPFTDLQYKLGVVLPPT